MAITLNLELLKKQRIQASIGKPVVAFRHILYYFVVDLVLEPYAQRIGSWLTADVFRCLAMSCGADFAYVNQLLYIILLLLMVRYGTDTG